MAGLWDFKFQTDTQLLAKQQDRVVVDKEQITVEMDVPTSKEQDTWIEPYCCETGWMCI